MCCCATYALQLFCICCYVNVGVFFSRVSLKLRRISVRNLLFWRVFISVPSPQHFSAHTFNQGKSGPAGPINILKALISCHINVCQRKPSLSFREKNSRIKMRSEGESKRERQCQGRRECGFYLLFLFQVPGWLYDVQHHRQ